MKHRNILPIIFISLLLFCAGCSEATVSPLPDISQNQTNVPQDQPRNPTISSEEPEQTPNDSAPAEPGIPVHSAVTPKQTTPSAEENISVPQEPDVSTETPEQSATVPPVNPALPEANVTAPEEKTNEQPEVSVDSPSTSDNPVSNEFPQPEHLQVKQGAVLIDITARETDDPRAVLISGNQFTITQAGTYQIYGTLSDGSIIVDAKKDAKIELLLTGAQITSSNYAPLYIKKADCVTVILPDNSQNVLHSTGEFLSLDENYVDAALFSKTDLIISGNGELIVSSVYGNGITGKDDLTIENGNICVTAAGHALEANDRIAINGGALTLTANKDTIHCENDEDLSLGIFTMNGGTASLSAGDDAIHAVASLTVNRGQLRITKCFEGFEAAKIYIAGGDIFMDAEDDGVNATVGAEINCYNGEAVICISGGRTEIITKGDALDSNGDILISGGEILTHGPGTDIFGFGTLDYVNKAEITGGRLIAFTSGGKSFSDTSTQASFHLNLSTLIEGTTVQLLDTNGNVIFSERAQLPMNCIIVSTPELVVDGVYTVQIGDQTYEVKQRKLVTKTKAK